MFKMLIVSLFASCLLVSGCVTDHGGRKHHGCHRTGVHRAGRHGNIHHHYAKPEHHADEKAR